MTTDELVRALASDTVSDRRKAAEAALQDPELARSAAIVLIDALTDDDVEVRETITSALEDCGRVEADPFALAQRLSLPEEAVQYWAATLLGRMGEDAKIVAGDMRAAKAHASPDIQARIERMLVKIENREV